MIRKCFSSVALAAVLACAGDALVAQVPAPPMPAPSMPTFPMPAMQRPMPRLTPAPPVPRIPPELSDAQARLLTDMLKDAAAEGLVHEADGTSEDDPVPTDNEALVWAALRHARAVHNGRLQSEDFIENWGLRPAPYDPWPGFVEAVEQDRLARWIAALPPPYTGYDGLRRGLVRYRELDGEGGWKTLSSGPDLSIGSSGERVAALRRRLAVEDKDVSTGSDAFDAELRDAVRRAQKRYGLNPTGTVSTQTLAALNVPAGERVRQIMANMERWRWLPPELAKDRVQVNIAAAVLTMFDGDRPVTSMRAVTGRPGDDTPMLQSQIHSIVLNPPWNVPQSIATRELWPKERANPGYLKRQGFKVIPIDGGGRRLQQRAGSKSALGRVKFDFDNRYAVYLHDTPTQGTFQRFDRLASHGCVRLERPVELAELVMRDDPRWGGAAVAEAIAKGDTVRARLEQPIAVYLLYWTAFASTGGQMNFRADPYGWDRTLADKIQANAAREMLASR